VGVPFPGTVYPVAPELNGKSLRYPVIIKGIEGLEFYKSQGRKSVLARSEEELVLELRRQARLESLKNVMVQEVIPQAAGERVISFTAFAVDGEIKAHWQGEKIREHPSRFGTATFCRSVHVPEMVDLGSRLVARLRYTGVCEIEFLKDPRDNRYKLLEINARTWLWVGLARACGVDYAMMIYNHVNGIDQSYPTEYRVGLKWVHLWTDLAFSAQGVMKRRYHARDLVRSFGGEVCFAVLSADDPLPFLYETVMLPKLARR
jgi:D-aspartate ligase